MRKILNRRQGIIDLMLTLALGVALGAATLVVTNEVIKNDNRSASRPTQNLSHEQKQRLLFDSAKRFFQARQEYEYAIKNVSNDIPIKRENLMRAKALYERAVVLNTPSPMPVLSHTPQRANNTGRSRQNPFDGASVMPAFSPNPRIPPVSIPLEAQAQAKAYPNAGSGGLAQNSGSSKVDYRKVRYGDTLSKICEKYYGDSGMWQHILKYQIPSIAAHPGSIFPGQMIALPKQISNAYKPQKVKPVAQFTKPARTTSYSQSVVSTTNQSNTFRLSNESWRDTFQKDYLISDYTLTNVNTMSAVQIQAFLDSKGSCLAKPYSGILPSQMIFNAARKYGINPQVILCRLQCEQGLISKKAATQKEYAWAVGVGCYHDGRRNMNFKGLEKQIEYSAHTFRRWYNDGKAKGDSITMTVSGQKVTTKNAASYSLYKYDPFFDSQKLFHDVWKKYF